jgi:hypothetical protein
LPSLRVEQLDYTKFGLDRFIEEDSHDRWRAGKLRVGCWLGAYNFGVREGPARKHCRQV